MITDPTTGPPSKIVFVLGPPGVGKGTLYKRLIADDAHNSGIYHLSVGDYLREISDPDYEVPEEVAKELLGDLPQYHIHDLVKMSIPIEEKALSQILKYKIKLEEEKGSETIIVDGFPRTTSAAKAFEKLIDKPTTVLLFSCQGEEAHNRLVARARSENDNSQLFNRRYEEFLDHHRGNPCHVYGQDQGGMSINYVNTSIPEDESYKMLLRALSLEAEEA